MNSYEDVRLHIAGRVRELREARGMSKKGLGRAASITAGYVTHIESGRRVPSVEILCTIATVLNVPVSALFASLPNP